MRKLAAGRLISSLGTSVADIAIAYSLFPRTHSAYWVSGLYFFTFGVNGLVAPLFGAERSSSTPVFPRPGRHAIGRGPLQLKDGSRECPADQPTRYATVAKSEPLVDPVLPPVT
jgi:hypothetical protein